MKAVSSEAFERTYKKLIKRRAISSKEFNKVIKQFEENYQNPTLHFKKIVCKIDKNRHSIRVLNSSYRIIMTILDQTAYLICICDHDDYDRRNRNC